MNCPFAFVDILIFYFIINSSNNLKLCRRMPFCNKDGLIWLLKEELWEK